MRFIVRKFIEAESIELALKKEKQTKPQEIFLDNEWKERQAVHEEPKPTSKLGFNANS